MRTLTFPAFFIVDGETVDGIKVHRVVEWANGTTCLGGRGSFFNKAGAEQWIANQK